MAAFFINVTDPPYNATGNGTTDDTAAVQAAINAASVNGGMVVFPPGTYAVSNLTISPGVNGSRGVQLRGASYFASSIKRTATANTILGGIMLDIAAHSVQLSDLRFEDYAYDGINPSPLVRFVNVNDYDVSRCWFFAGEIQLQCYFGDQSRVHGCVIEASRRHGLHFLGSGNSRVQGNVFYRSGSLTVDNPNNASIKIEAVTGHSAPGNYSISGNYFLFSQLGHFIQATTAVGIAITGNFFRLAGIYNEGAYDEINLVDCDRVAIAGNVSTTGGDPIDPVSRVSRWVVKIDSNCSKVRIGDNSFEPALSGTIDDAAADTYISASIDGNGPRKTLNATQSWTPPLLYPGTGAWTSVTVTGARPGDNVTASWVPLGSGAFLLTANVAANDTVNVTLFNGTPNAYQGPAGDLVVTVWKKA